MSDLLAQLNEPQRQAVLHDNGPLLLLAGAGSGKTRALTHRVAYLIRERGVPTWQIMAVTFTNKAAAEMRERLEQLLGKGETPWVATFHASCVRICGKILLRSVTRAISPSMTTRISCVCSRTFLKLRTFRKKSSSRARQRLYRQCQNRGKGPADLSHVRADEQILVDIYSLYQQKLKEANAVDFGDLLLLTVRLLNEHDDIRLRWQQRFSHVLIDEFRTRTGFNTS